MSPNPNPSRIVCNPHPAHPNPNPNPNPNQASRLAIVAARLLPSLIALGGVIVLTSAPSAEGAGTELKQEATMGMLFSLVSAVCYALHTMR